MYGMARRRRVHTRRELGSAHRTQVEQRTAIVMRLTTAGTPVAERIASAPPGYLLSQSSSDIIRHATMLGSLPAPREVRVATTPGRITGEWQLDVATRDRPGILAAFTGVLHEAGLDVTQAILATWDDAAALQTFVIRSIEPPDDIILQHSLSASLDRPLTSSPVAEALVSFDHAVSPLYTSCVVTAVDQPGLLHTIAVAVATAGIDIHAASVTTIHGIARDSFDLSDRSGRKLNEPFEDTIRFGIQNGVIPVRRARGRTTRHPGAPRP